MEKAIAINVGDSLILVKPRLASLRAKVMEVADQETFLVKFEEEIWISLGDNANWYELAILDESKQPLS